MGRNLRKLKQVANTIDKKQDAERQALLPGKRITVKGNIYWETRENRSDVKPSKRL